LPFDFHATLASELSKSQFYTSFWRLTLISCEGAAPGPTICILPRVWMSDLRDLCRGLPVPERNSHCTTCLCIRNARSPQTVAAGKEVLHFTTPNVCPSDTHDLRRGLPKDKQDPHFATRFWESDTPQRVTFRKPMPGCPCRQREIEELEKSDFAGVQIQFDHLEVS